MLPIEIMLLLSLTPLTVHATPLKPRDLPLPNPLSSLKSVASGIFSIATATDGIFTAGPDATTISSGHDPLVATASSPASQTTGGTENGSTAAVTGTSGGGTQTGTASGTAAQSVSSSAPDSDNSSRSGAFNTISTGTGSDSSGSPSTSAVSGTGTGSGSASATTNLVVPTTTGGGGSPGSGNDGGGSSSGSDPEPHPDPSDPNSSSGSGSSTSQKSSLSPGEIAAAVILPVSALLLTLCLLFGFCQPLRKRYTTWRQTRLERSAYRRALDDPVMSSFSLPRHSRGRLGMDSLINRPLSFGFSRPAAQRIERKPLNWDASRIGENGILGIGVAVPLGAAHEREHGSHSRTHSHARTMSSISERSEPRSRL